MVVFNIKSKQMERMEDMFYKILPGVIEEIKTHANFQMADCSGKEISESFNYVIYQKGVVVYQKWYWKKWVNAWTKRSNKIWFNTRKINRELFDLMETLGHELTHIADTYDKRYSFGHGDNRLAGKDLTAPVVIGKIFKKHTIIEMGLN